MSNSRHQTYKQNQNTGNATAYRPNKTEALTLHHDDDDKVNRTTWAAHFKVMPKPPLVIKGLLNT